jgi:hypothetical protein
LKIFWTAYKVPKENKFFHIFWSWNKFARTE